MSYIVYIAVCRVNQKAYVGMTGKTMKRRRQVHISRAKSGDVGCTLFYNAIRKHGADAFDWGEIWRGHGKFDCEQKEIEFIKLLRPAYNLDAGGRGGAAGRKLSKKQREQLRVLGLKNKDQWMIYAKMGSVSMRRPVVCLNTGERYESVAQAAQKLEIHASTITEVCNRKKYRHSVGGLIFRFENDDRRHTENVVSLLEEKRKRISGSSKAQRKIVICLNDGAEYASAVEAGIAYGISRMFVNEICRGEKSSRQGLRFSYQKMEG